MTTTLRAWLMVVGAALFGWSVGGEVGMQAGIVVGAGVALVMLDRAPRRR